jgi:hypothetical protein
MSKRPQKSLKFELFCYFIIFINFWKKCVGLRHKRYKNLKKLKIHMEFFFFFLRFNLTWSQKLMFTFTQFYSKIFFICTQHFNNIGFAFLFFFFFFFFTCSPSRDYIDLPTTKSQVPKAFLC